MFFFFYKSLKIFNDFSRENHGHGVLEHGIRRGKLSFKKMSVKIFNDFSRENHGHGVLEHGIRRGKLSFKKMSAGGRLCTLQENPHFWVPVVKVKPPDGMRLILKKKVGGGTLGCLVYGSHSTFGRRQVGLIRLYKRQHPVLHHLLHYGRARRLLARRQLQVQARPLSAGCSRVSAPVAHQRCHAASAVRRRALEQLHPRSRRAARVVVSSPVRRQGAVPTPVTAVLG